MFEIGTYEKCVASLVAYHVVGISSGEIGVYLTEVPPFVDGISHRLDSSRGEMTPSKHIFSGKTLSPIGVVVEAMEGFKRSTAEELLDAMLDSDSCLP